MTVEDLTNTLKLFPADMKVFLSTDEEGNSFEPLFAAEEAYTDDLDIWRTTPPADDKVLVLWP